MTAQDQIGRLEALLGKIRGNATRPRVEAMPPAPSPVPAPVAVAPPPTPPPPSVKPRMRAESPPLPRAEPVAPGPLRAEAPPLTARQSPAPPEIEELDMMDAEIVELGADAPSLEADIGAGADEPVPESAPRPALQVAADEREIEPPVKTPPPESGRQAVTAAPAISYGEEAVIGTRRDEIEGSADVDALLEADLSGTPISKAPPGQPTMEQLGETVELEGADAPAAKIELAVPVAERRRDEPDALELSLPRREFAGAYDAALAPPEGAKADLDRHRETRDRAAAPAPPVSLPAPASGPISFAAETVPAVAQPVVIARPAPLEPVHPAEIVLGKALRVPETFLEILDASLRL